MSFKTGELKFNALVYRDNASPMEIKEQTISLVKQDDGTYNVPPNNILVKVHSAALNPIDLILYQSAYTVTSLYNNQQGIGRDYSGTIEAIGKTAKCDYEIGDAVCGMYTHPMGKGTVSEYILLDSTSVTDSSITAIPQNLSMNEAAAWPLVFGTAYQMIKDRIQVDSGTKVLVLGGSTSVGRFCIQLCKNYFKSKEIVTTCSLSSAPLARSFGADHVIDYTMYDSIEEPVLKAALSGKFDLILDCCGNSDLFHKMPQILKPKSEKSHYVTITGDTKYNYSSVTLSHLFFSKAAIRQFTGRLGLLPFSYDRILCQPGKDWINEAKDIIEKSLVKVSIDSVHNLENFHEAIKVLRSNKANGKIVIQIDSK